MKNLTGEEILRLPMESNDADAKTIGDYLLKLSEEVWKENECFSGKRPFGNSGWEHELYIALARNEAIVGKIDEDGYLEEYDEATADKLVKQAFAALREFVAG